MMGYGNGGQRFEPKPGTGTLFIKGQKRSGQSPDYDGYFIADRVIQAGEKIKLVGWDKQAGSGNMITLKEGKAQQEFPQNNGGYAPQQQRGGFQGQQAPQPGYAPRGGYAQQAPQQGYQNQPNQSYGQGAPQQQYRAPVPQQGYQSGPPLTYAPPQGQYVPPGPNGNGAPPPADEGDLPF